MDVNHPVSNARTRIDGDFTVLVWFMRWDEAVRELYALPREQFVRARDRCAKEAADPEFSARLKTLRKPPLSAWIADAVATARPDRIAELRQLSQQLRDAHERLDGARLRELSARRIDLLRVLLAHARDTQESVSDTVLEQLRTIFTAALTEPAVAESLAAGTLAEVPAADPFGAWTLPKNVPESTASKPPAAKSTRAPRTTRGTKKQAAKAQAAEARKSAARERHAAERELLRAQAELSSAKKSVDKLTEALKLAENRRAEAERKVADATRKVERNRVWTPDE